MITSLGIRNGRTMPEEPGVPSHLDGWAGLSIVRSYVRYKRKDASALRGACLLTAGGDRIDVGQGCPGKAEDVSGATL